MNETRGNHLTPWVTRLLVLNGAVLVLLGTVFTADRFFNALAFDPGSFSARPWTALTYQFVHSDLVHFALTGLAIFCFGPPVERRLGSRRFLAYYVYCGVGAALFSLAGSTVVAVDPFVGASGAAYGIGLAFVLAWPSTPVSALPIPVTARSLFIGLLVADLIFGFWGRDGIAHFAHLGGALAGYVFFQLQSLTARKPPARPAPVRRPVVTPMRVQDSGSELRPAPTIPERMPESSSQELDRLLDKISQFGLDSLTSQERRFLSETSERKRREQA